MAQALRVGMIGVNAERGWAREGHVPAVQALEGLDLVAVATRHQDSADAAASATGAARAYGDPADLIADPGVDVVTVAASVPAHRDLVLAALAAGKHVLTEWPVGIDAEQSDEIAAAAAASGLHTAVGLQARVNPAAVAARDAIASGRLGRVLTATVLSTTAGFGPVVTQDLLYLEDPATGMNLTTIQHAHTLDLAVELVGPLTSVAALSTIQFPQLTVAGRTEPYRRTVADHVLVHARLADGGALTIQVAGGYPPERCPFHLEVVGTGGRLVLRGGGPRGFQAGVLALEVDGQAVEVDPGQSAGLPDPVVNVAHLYAALRDDVATGSTTAPSFAHAARLAHLVDDVLACAADGRTRAVQDA